MENGKKIQVLPIKAYNAIFFGNHFVCPFIKILVHLNNEMYIKKVFSYKQDLVSGWVIN